MMSTKSYKVSRVRTVGQLSITDVNCVQPISSMRKEAIYINEFYHPTLIPDTSSTEVPLTCWHGDFDCVQPISSMGFIIQPTALIPNTFCDFLFNIVLEAAQERLNNPHPPHRPPPHQSFACNFSVDFSVACSICEKCRHIFAVGCRRGWLQIR